MLFYCFWEEEWPSLLVEADDAAAASSAGAGEAEGNPPDRVAPLREAGAAVVIGEVHIDDAKPEDVPPGENPADFLVATIETGDELQDVLIALETQAEDVDEPEASGEFEAVCGDEMQEEEGGAVLVCDREPDHDGDHEGEDANGERAAWPQEG